MKDELVKAVEFCRHLRIKYTTPLTGDEIVEQYRQFVGKNNMIGKYGIVTLIKAHGFKQVLHTYRKDDNSRTTSIMYEYDPDLAVF